MVKFTHKEVRYLSDRDAFESEEAIEYLVGHELVDGFLRVFIDKCKRVNKQDDADEFCNFNLLSYLVNSN
jgi:hypothetical protein